MWRAAQPKTSTHPTHQPVPPASWPASRHSSLITRHSSLITRHCLIQSLAKHNRKPMQLPENKPQRPKSIASFCHVFRNPSAFSDDATSIVILRPAPLPQAGRRISPPSARRGKTSPFVTTEKRVSSRTESRASSCPPQFGGRGTQRGICFSRNSTRPQILIGSVPLLETAAND
jgi:hypothetical protein